MILRASCLALSIIAGVFVSDASAQAITWAAPQTVAASSFDNQHPRIVLSGNGNPVILWGNNAASAAYLSRWTGTGFTSPVKLNSMGISIFADSWAGPDLASKGDTVYAIFKAKPEDTAGIYIVRSFNGGATFSMPARVDNIPGYSSRFPTITTDATGQPVVGFMKFNTGFISARWVVISSTDFGASFSADALASSYNGEPVCDCCPGTVISTGNNVAMLYRNNWSDKRTSWAGISMNGGATFPSGMEVDKTNWTISACPSSGPDGVIIGDDLYTTFMSGAGGTKVYYSKSTISSMMSYKETSLTAGSAGISGQNFPRIANDGKSVVIVWPQQVNGAPTVSFLFAADIDNGFQPWDTVVRNASGNSIMNADVVIKNGTVHVVWEDMASGTVKYRKGTFAKATNVAQAANDHTFELSPVPADAFLQLRMTGGKPIDQYRLTITDFTGRVVHSRSYSTSSGQVQVPTAELPGGHYMVQISSGSTILTRKFSIEHQ